MDERPDFDVNTLQGREQLRAWERLQTQEKRAEQRQRNRAVAEDDEAMRAYMEATQSRTVRLQAEQRQRGRYVQSAPGFHCGPNTFRCQTARDMTVETPECCKFWVRSIMRDVSQLLTAAGIRWWIDYGTLLGYLRHGGLIPWDKDGDLGMLAEDRPKLMGLLPRWIDLGYHPTYAPPRKERFRSGDRVKVRLSVRNHTNVDVFLWERRPKGMLDRQNYIGADLYKGRDFPEELALPTSVGLWDGIEVAVPADPEALVAWRYGEDWRTPQHTKHPPKPRRTWREEHA